MEYEFKKMQHEQNKLEQKRNFYSIKIEIFVSHRIFLKMMKHQSIKIYILI